MRLFVALDLPEAVKEQLGLMCCGLPGARWTPAEQLHLTLRFIGETDGAMLKDIQESLTAIRSQPFSLQLKGIGFFPPRQEPHTLWAGVEKSEPLLLLHRKIEAALAALGLEPEPRNFAPHVTLARLHSTPASRIGGFLAQHSLFAAPSFSVSTFRLYRSILAPEGSKYSVEEEYLLAG